MKQDLTYSIYINRDELQLLLNLIRDDLIVLEYPLYQLKMLRVQSAGKKYRVHVTCREEDFESVLSTCGNYAEELPSYDDISYCMLLSRIADYRNMEEFREKLKLYEKLDKTVYFALDTNLFYQGFPTKASFIKNPNYLVVNTVYNEIEGAINHKYHPHQIYEMAQIVDYHEELLAELENRKTKKARKASYVAMKEYRAIRNGALEIEAIEPATYSKEQNDLIIVRTLRDFDFTVKYGHTVLLTADTNVSNLCMGKGPECFLFEYPSPLEASECTAKQLVDLIFSLAVTCGLIKLNFVVIYGEFSYKGRRDNDLKLVFQNEKLYRLFMIELETCRKLMNLGIEK